MNNANKRENADEKGNFLEKYNNKTDSRRDMNCEHTRCYRRN